MYPSKPQILRLYKHLIRYGSQVTLTDKSYILGRIRREFRENKNLTNPADIEFSFKRRSPSEERPGHLILQMSNLLASLLCSRALKTRLFVVLQICPSGTRWKSNDLDYSRYPKLNEEDLEETFTRGSGPGGQAVNKTSNCVLLRHKPTNIIVKCHTHRITSRNRSEARKILLEKLDAHFNGANSIASQLKNIELKKGNEKKRRQQKLNKMKEKWKQYEEIETNK